MSRVVRIWIGSPVLEREPQVLGLPVRAHEDGLLGQLRADRGSRVEPRRAVGKFEFRRVGKNDLHDRAEYVPREDDRNEEIPESPAPDPEEGSQGAEDDPGLTNGR